jgi:hypothetical protein
MEGGEETACTITCSEHTHAYRHLVFIYKYAHVILQHHFQTVRVTCKCKAKHKRQQTECESETHKSLLTVCKVQSKCEHLRMQKHNTDREILRDQSKDFPCWTATYILYTPYSQMRIRKDLCLVCPALNPHLPQ